MDEKNTEYPSKQAFIPSAMAICVFPVPGLPYMTALLPSLIKSNVSNTGTTAVSWIGAKGLMQLMPKTARALGVPDGKEQNAEESVKAATKYLAELGRSFSKVTYPEEKIKFILASYNAGIGHVFDAMALAEKYGKTNMCGRTM